MTVPAEYERASAKFYQFLVETRDQSDLWSTHVTYTMVQGVLQTFRSRLTVQETALFANVLPVCLRALFVTDWNPSEPAKSFQDRATMTKEVQALRGQHNFSPSSAIADVATVLRRFVDEEQFDQVLEQLPEGAQDFWSTRGASRTVIPVDRS
jgi:uncharacterized protein (DUF2267 family)